MIGRVEAIELEPLVESIWKYWDYKNFDPKLLQYKNIEVVVGNNFIY